jgi:FMN phosphatase YigB (HAD superfamily)
MAMTFRPRYITFDCYGTLIDFQIGALTRTLLADRLDPARMPRFLTDFSAYRLDETLGPREPYAEVIKTATPGDLPHVSSSLRYDLMSAHDVGIRHCAYIERGHGPSTSDDGHPTLKDLSALPALVGLE